MVKRTRKLDGARTPQGPAFSWKAVENAAGSGADGEGKGDAFHSSAANCPRNPAGIVPVPAMPPHHLLAGFRFQLGFRNTNGVNETRGGVGGKWALPYG